MFEQLFERSHALARQHTGPLKAERLAYLHHLKDQGVLQRTLRVTAQHLLVVSERLRLAERPGEVIGSAEIATAARKWATRASSVLCASAQARFFRYATEWLAFLGQLEVPASPASPYAALLRAFGDFMQEDRGLSQKTIRYRCLAVEEFLEKLGPTEDALKTLTVLQVDDLLVDKVTRGGYARVSVQTYASTLRAFFRFAEMQEACPSGLAAAIKSPRVFPDESLPRGPSWPEVQRLLQTTLGDRPNDIRDRAILLLLSVYGLRAGEVIGLRLDDFDWEKERLLVRRPKSQRAQTYPLSHPVGDAVLRYLREVRPASVHREVFLTSRAPYRPLWGGIWRIVARRLRPLCSTPMHHGPHSLRHACATHLLSEGLSLKEIGDHLGHRHPDTTRIYAKVDLVGLRQVADLDLGGLL